MISMPCPGATSLGWLAAKGPLQGRPPTRQPNMPYGAVCNQGSTKSYIHTYLMSQPSDLPLARATRHAAHAPSVLQACGCPPGQGLQPQGCTADLADHAIDAIAVLNLQLWPGGKGVRATPSSHPDSNHDRPSSIRQSPWTTPLSATRYHKPHVVYCHAVTL